jgi:hypothetical protein
MIRIINQSGTGKTSQLMLLAKENNATFVCENPRAMRVKAQAYGLEDINFISYHDFLTSYDEGNVVIDELELFVKSMMGDNKLIAYSLTTDN